MLVVEPQGELRRTIVTMLKQGGAGSVQGIPNGEEALEYIVQSPVDMIVSEWKLPKMNGIDLLRDIRNSPLTAIIPFVLLSNQGDLKEGDYAEAGDYDVDGFLIKPLNQQDLGGLVEDVLAKNAEFLEPSIHLARARAFVDVGEAEEAENEIVSAQEVGAHIARVWVDSGGLFEELGESEKARESYQKATEVDKECAKAYEGMANILEVEGKTEEAYAMLQKAVELSPQNRDRQFKMAKQLMEHGDEDAARIALHHALESEPDAASQSAAAAEFFMEIGRADLAEAEYAFALEADPSNVHYFNRLGLAFRRQKKYKDAIANYRKAITVAPDDAEITLTWQSPWPKARITPSPSAPSGALLSSSPIFRRPRNSSTHCRKKPDNSPDRASTWKLFHNPT
jgi:tetratricopeptide (TPR) repeat protein